MNRSLPLSKVLCMASLLCGMIGVSVGTPAQADYLATCFAVDATDRLRVEACGFAAQNQALDAADRAKALARRAEIIGTQLQKNNRRFDLLELARADIEEARRLAPEDPDVQRIFVAINAHWFGQTDEQIAAVNSVLSMEGEDAGLLLQRGLAAFRRGDNEHALADIERSIAVDGKNAEAYRVAGTILTTLLRNNESVQAFSKAIELAPDDPLLRFERAGPAVASQQFALARDDYDAVLPTYYPDKLGWQMRGLARYALADYEGAAPDFAHDFRIDKGQVKLLVWEYLAQRRAGSVSAADAALKAKTLGDKWPSAVFRYFGDTVDVKDVLAQAARAPDEIRPARISQAKFFIAEWQKIIGSPEDEFRALYIEVKEAGFLFGSSAVQSDGAMTMVNDDTIMEVSLAVARLQGVAP